jgi:formate-dependent nitrite reductase membrane component NrfD
MIVQIVAMVAFVFAGSGASAMTGMFSTDLSAGLWIVLLGLGLLLPLLMTVQGRAWLPATALIGIVLCAQGYLFLRHVVVTESLIVPIVFFTTAMVAGVATELVVLSLLRMTGRVKEDNTRIPVLGKISNRLMIVQIAVVAIVLIAGAGMPTVANAQLGAILCVFVVVLGLLVPLLMTVKGKAWMPATSLVTALLVLEGGFFLRYVILMVGQT